MREIKFRYYDITVNTMLIPECIGQYGVYKTGRDFENGHSLPFDGLMQFTGLKDKNGKEIYEGDIIRFRVDFPEQPYDDGVVRFASGGFWTSQTVHDLEELLSEELNELDGEVIGNIYENPNLLQ